MTLIEPVVGRSPLWWRIPVWSALLVVSILTGDHLWQRIVGGVLMGLGVLALQFLDLNRRALQQLCVLAAVVLGHAACYVLTKGFAEVLVVVAAARSPKVFDTRALWWFTGLTALAFGTTVADISDSLPGLLAGLAIPFLVQRSLEQQVIVRERDRAQALLTEVQAGHDAETAAAALRERGRIAREMHDVLAHSLAGLSVQLQAVRALAARERTAPAVLEQLDRAAQLARDGLAEARAAVGTLRDPVGLGVDDLPALVQRTPGRAHLEVDGQPGAVAPEAGHAVYRAVQEALTNSARYAPGSPVAVALDWQRDRLLVTVTDDGPAPGRRPVGGQGTGLGLAGMAERVGAAGGTVTSGPHEDGGWRTAIEVPTAEEAT